MTLQEIIELAKQDGGSWVLFIVIILSLVQITPIKINPWTAIFKWLGRQINSDINDRLTTIETVLSNHIKESTERELRAVRTSILNFGTSCMRGEGHTKEEFDFIISECDKYEQYCKNNSVTNGVANATMRNIRRLYDAHLRENSFLTEGASND